MKLRDLSRRTIVAASCLMLALPAGAQSAQAVRPIAGDGEPTPAACAAVGIDLSRDQQGRERGRSSRPSMTGVPPPPPPPPMPSPPPPPVAAQSAPAAVDSIAVTGARMARPAYGSISPVTPLPHARPDTEQYPDATPNPVQRTADQPVSTFSIDVDTASYSNVRRFIDEGRTPPADAVRVEEMINYFDYGYARPGSRNAPFAVTTAVTASPWAEGRQIVHVGLQGYELPAGQRAPLNLTFLVDVSGSMGSADKLDLAKRAMNLVIDRLRPQDTVAVTYYAHGAGTALAPTSGDQKLRIRCAVESLQAGGATAGATGMTNAYDQAEANFGEDRVNRILMFTDGDFNVGVTANERLEDYVAGRRETGIYLSVYGFGRGNYQDARMQAIAQAGNGVAAYVDDLNEARRLFGPRFDQGAFPIADDVKIQVEFNPARVAEYRLIGYETRLLDEADFNNDRVDAGEVGSGASVTALYEITPVGGPTQIGERRYGQAPAAGDPSGELAFVQVRYKLPGEDDSVLMQQPVTGGARVAPESTRWAMAVAAFGQRLRGDPWMSPDFDWDDIRELAQGARGDDPYGERAEFIQLVRAAEGLPERREP